MATFRNRNKRDGSKVVNVQVRVAGFPSRTASFSTRRLAERWAKVTEAEMIEGRHFRNPESRRRTLAQAIERYTREELPKKKNGGMHRAALPWWSERIGHLKLSAITPELIVDCRAELASSRFKRARPESKRTLLAAGEKPNEFPRSGATVNRYISCLSHVFTVARKEWGWTSGNPVSDVSKLREGKPRDKVLTDGERSRLLKVTANNKTLHALIVTSLSVAARVGELLDLVWSDVDLKRGQITFRDTKNSSARSAWLTGESKKLVKRLAKAPHENTDRVFRSVKGNGRFQYSGPYEESMAAAGITGFTFHGLRHSAATYFAQQGATEQQLKAIGGWKSNAVNRYIHLASQDTRALVTQMNTRVLGSVK